MMDMSVITTVAVGALIMMLIALFSEIQRIRNKKKEPTLHDKIAELTNKLASAVAVISEIEQEILKRKELVAQQQADMARYDQLMQVSKDQLEAIAQTLSIPVKKESIKSLWLNILATLLIAGAFFALGYFFRGG